MNGPYPTNEIELDDPHRYKKAEFQLDPTLHPWKFSSVIIIDSRHHLTLNMYKLT